MSRIKNEAKIKNPIVVKVREQLEHRAMWLALLDEEARAKGVDPATYGRAASYKCGRMQGLKFADGHTSFK